VKEVKCPTCWRTKEVEKDIIISLCPICLENMEEFIVLYEKE